MSDFDTDESLVFKQSTTVPSITRERQQNQRRQLQEDENTNSFKHKLKLFSSRATQGNVIKEDEEEDMPLTLFGNTNSDHEVYEAKEPAKEPINLLDDSVDLDNNYDSMNLDTYTDTTFKSRSEGSLLDFEEDVYKKDDAYKNTLRMKSVSRLSIDDDDEEEEEQSETVMGIQPRETKPEGGFFSTVASTESPFLKQNILPKPEQHINFTKQQEAEKLRKNQEQPLKKALENTWKFTQGAAQAVGRTTTNVWQGTVDFLLEPIPEEVGYRNVQHGEEDLYEVNKFTVFEEKLDRFLDDVLDGPEGEGNLGWYRRVQIKDLDEDEEFANEYYPKTEGLDTKANSNVIKATMTNNTTDTKSSTTTLYQDESTLNQKEISTLSRDLLDEIHSLKLELQKSKVEKESLEEELLSCYEQKENLSAMVKRLRDREADFMQSRRNQVNQADLLGIQNDTKEEQNVEQKHKDVLLEKKETIKKEEKPISKEGWEEKVKLWKKILKGIEMDMIISSKTKACNTQMHLKFITQVENNSKLWNELLDNFYYSNDENIKGGYSFKKEVEITFDKGDALLDVNVPPIPTAALLDIPPIPTAPPPPPPEDDTEPVIVQFDDSNLFGGTPDVAVDLIGLEDTYETTHFGNTTPFVTVPTLLPPDLFVEPNIEFTAPMGTDNTLVDFNYDATPSHAADFMDLVPPPMEAPPLPPIEAPPPPPEAPLEETETEDKAKEKDINKRFGFFRLFTKRDVNEKEKDEAKDKPKEEEKEETKVEVDKEVKENKEVKAEKKVEAKVEGGGAFIRLFGRKKIENNEEIKDLEQETAPKDEDLEETEAPKDEDLQPEEPIELNKECIYQEIQTYLYSITPPKNPSNLPPSTILRYSRQLLLQDGFGTQGQTKLSQAKVLVVGAGGIGSTVLLYLAALGIGSITIIDNDTVEVSNLHRQIIHTQERVGMNKASSARITLEALNPSITLTDITTQFNHLNAMELCSSHDIVVDCTDNPRSRYLINDACVLASKPLVSGSAMGTEGQVTVYNYEGCACYRCLYPKIDEREGCKSCSDNGVLGPVPGVIGILQSLEVVKILTGIGQVLNQKLLMYDSLSSSFIPIQKPKPSPSCEVCSADPIITTMLQSFLTLKSARGGTDLPCAKSLPPKYTVSCKEYYDECIRTKRPHVLLDVRVRQQFEMCHLPNSTNIPLEELENLSINDILNEYKNETIPIYCICRRGVASVDAVNLLLEKGQKFIYNIDGGFTKWSEEVDPSFPKY